MYRAVAPTIYSDPVPCRSISVAGPPPERISDVYLLPTPRRPRAAQATTIAPRWQTLWRQHGPFGGTLARIFGPRIWRGRRTPLAGKSCTGQATVSRFSTRSRQSLDKGSSCSKSCWPAYTSIQCALFLFQALSFHLFTVFTVQLYMVLTFTSYCHLDNFSRYWHCYKLNHVSLQSS